MFQHVGLFWLIESKDQLKFNFDQQCSYYINNGPCYNTNIFSHLHVTSFEDFFTTAYKYRYDLICSIRAYEKLNPTCYDYAGIGGGRPLQYGSTSYDMVLNGHTLNFIESWLE